MTNADCLPTTVLSRKAVVYVRQSTQTQVQINLESRRRQYDLVEEARRRGFREVEVIDDNSGRSASGTVARPGFEKLVVAGLCGGEVGAVLRRWYRHRRLARLDQVDEPVNAEMRTDPRNPTIQALHELLIIPG